MSDNTTLKSRVLRMFGRKASTLPDSFGERKYRRDSIAEILAKGFPPGKVALLDRWVIEDVRVNGISQFMPRPLWDREALLTRNSFDTEDEAHAEIARNEGELLD